MAEKEQSKEVITEKRKYFVPGAGLSVEADNPEEAAKAAEEAAKADAKKAEKPNVKTRGNE